MPVELVEAPAEGRVYVTTRRVRLGDSSPGGRLRLDALARLLQDVSDDDTRSAGFEDAAGWVVRRTAVRVESFPVYLDVLHARTWCSGTGGRWAERRISVRGESGGSIETATLWVHLDPSTMRPLPLPPRFHEIFGGATAGRTVRASLHHAPLPEGLSSTRAFPLRFTDFDVLGHVNNANYWAPVEEELARRRDLRAPLRVEVEHRDAIEQGELVDVHVREGEGTVELWLVERGTTRVYATARIEALA
ncbi:MAG: acyl-[acyl-carrier-protein] thioesterase [Acidimicrobiia bacterium]